MSDPFETFGPPELCTWRYGAGVCRFQTSEPRFAKKLSKRSGASLVGCSVTSRYLRIFQEQIEPWRARDLVRRYWEAVNGAFSDRTAAPSTPKVADKVISAGERDISTN